MKSLQLSRLHLMAIAAFAISGWGVAWFNHSSNTKNTQPARITKSARARESLIKDLHHNAKNPSLCVSDASFSQLLSSLSDISNSARTGEPNQKLVLACAKALASPDPQHRARDFNLLIELMRPEDAAALHQQFLTMHQTGKGYGPEYGAFAKRWGEIDALGALHYLTSDVSVSLPIKDFQEIARGWGQTDPQGAIKWMKEHPELCNDMDGRYALLDGWFRTDSASATRWMLAEKMPVKELAHCICGGAWQQLFSSDAVNAAKWLSQLPDDHGEIAAATRVGWYDIQGQLSQISYEQASTAWSQLANASWMTLDDFKNFGNIVAHATANTEGLPGYLNSIATKWPAEQVSRKFEQWATSNPEAVIEWLTHSPNSNLQKPALEGAIRALEQNNNLNAAEQLRQRLK